MENINDTVREEKPNTKVITLIEGDASKYLDNYVALAGKKIVAFGKDPNEVIKTAEKQGFKETFIVYVPKIDNQLYKIA